MMDDDTILRDAIADAERQVKKKKRQVFEPVKRQPTKLLKPKNATKKKLTTLELFRKKKQLGKNTEAQNLLRKPTKDKDKPHLLTVTCARLLVAAHAKAMDWRAKCRVREPRSRQQDAMPTSRTVCCVVCVRE